MKTALARAFTLIEVMLVITIIGLLAVVVLASLSQTKGKATISKRIQSAKEIQNALELYYAKNGQYPSTCNSGPVPLGTCTANNATAGSMCTGLDTLWPGGSTPTTWVPGIVAAGFISSLPTDPNQSGLTTCCYRYKSTGTDYKLQIAYNCKATVGTYTTFPTFTDPNHDGSADCTATPAGVDGDVSPTWAIYTPGACGGNWN